MHRYRYAILLALCWWPGALKAQLVRNADICGPHNGRRIYLELGEQGVLRADNVTLAKNSPQLLENVHRSYTANSSHEQCSLELVTCPSCVISLTFTSINLLQHCGDGGMTIDSPCRCDYIWISEPAYEDVSGTPFCGLYSPITYRSSTRSLSITLLYSQFHQHAFTVQYTAERNRLVLKGSSAIHDMTKSMNNTGGGILTSPFFPSRYPRDLGMEYIISCPHEIPSCRVRILFSDFQLAAISIIEFFDWNGQRLDVSSGARFRPPIIVSSGPSLLMRFYANGGTGLGYKAFYSFVPVHLYDLHSQPITDCGGYVENLGGTITMMDMVGEGIQTYDCVWLIRPPKNFVHMKTHIYLKVITFAEMAGNTELIVKQGPTSALLPLEVLRHPINQLQPPRMREHLAPVSNGFHVSLRGSFSASSRLAIAYAAFSYVDCYPGSDFLCQNHRCIPNQLNCDGFDHCGDNSDEPSTCLNDWDIDGLPDRKWHQSKANYYFPKIERYPDLKTATLVFIISSLGLIVLITALIILLYRIGARARQQRELQSRLRTISELLDGTRIDEISVTDDPPVYEAPPNYEEVIKLGMEDETGCSRRKRRRTPRESRRSRSVASSQCSCELEHQLTLNLHEEGSSSNYSSQTTPIQSDPAETPPPPYVSPTGTIRRQYSLDINLPGPSGVFSSGDNARQGDSPGSSTCVRVHHEEYQDAETRRSWLRNSGSFSRSLPTSRAASTSPSGHRCISSDGDGLGAYPPVPAPRAHRTQPHSRVPQPATSSAVSESSRAVCAVVSPGPVTVVDEDDDEPEHRATCDCAGACGCATVNAALLPRRPSFDYSPSTRSRIVRLLAGARSANPTSIFTGSSVSSGACTSLQPPSRLSIASSQDTRISNLSADDLEIVSETSSILGSITPRGTPCKLISVPIARRFELESLYESIRVLDSFLAQRETSRPRGGRSHSVAVMLYGTPRQRPYSRSHGGSAEIEQEAETRIRVWKSTDDGIAS